MLRFATSADAVIHLSLSHASALPVSADYSTANGTALAGSDYEATSGTVTFAPGEAMKTVLVRTLDDALSEGDETFTVSLTNPLNAVIADGQAMGTIVDDDFLPSVALSVGGGTWAENGGVATVSATLSAVAPQDATVHLSFAGAASAEDYTTSAASIVILAGQLSGSITLTALDDLVDEPNESIQVSIASVVGGLIGAPSLVAATIIDDDPPPSLSIDNVSIVEGNSGDSIATFTVSLSAASAFPVSVDVQTANGSATAPSDYVATGPLTLVFAPGETSKTLQVAIAGDLLIEANETFLVNLTNPVNAMIGDGQGVGAITNDDAVPSVQLALNANTLDEEGGVATVTATLSNAFAQNVTVFFAFGGTASTSDYTASATNVVIPAGQLSRTITLTSLADGVDEADETIEVSIGSVAGATVGAPSTTTATIIDHRPAPTLSINDATVVEGDVGSTVAEFTVSLSAASHLPISVDVQTANLFAVAGFDYVAAGPTTLVFAAGETTKTFQVAVLGDVVEELIELFLVNLSNPINATIASGAGVGRILDDDGDAAPTVTLSLAGSALAENGGVATVTATLSNPLAHDVTVNLSFGGTASASDYSASDTSIVIPAGQTARSISITAQDDLIDEPNEAVAVSIASAAGVTPGAPSAVTAQIIDDDVVGGTPPPIQRRFAVGVDAGADPLVMVFDASTGALVRNFLAYDTTFQGGVRVAAGDVTGDGVDDVVTGAGPGGGPHIKVFDGANGSLVFSFFAFNAGFGGGVYVATGDVNGDGRDDMIVGAGEGGGPHVRVFSGRNQALIRDFFAYDINFRGGVRVAAGLFANTSAGVDIITAAGPTGGPHVKVFDGQTLTLVHSYFAFDSAFRGGVYVAAGDIDGDGWDDVIAGAGQGGGSNVRVFESTSERRLLEFLAYDALFSGGVRVGATDRNGDEVPDIAVTFAEGSPQRVKIFDPLTLDAIDEFFAFDDLVAPGALSASVQDARGAFVG